MSPPPLCADVIYGDHRKVTAANVWRCVALRRAPAIRLDEYLKHIDEAGWLQWLHGYATPRVTQNDQLADSVL